MKNKIRAIIIDDEKNSIEALEYELEDFHNEIEIIDKCLSASQGIKSIKKNKPDLVFLDIEMPNINGFEMLEKLDMIDFEIVFTTAYDQFALKAFEISAMDYLLKPVNNTDLKKVISKIRKQIDEPEIQRQLEMLFELMKSKNPEFPTIALPTMDTLEFIEINNIVNCTSDSNYTYVYTIENEKYYVSKTLKEVESMLKGHNFVRVHHSHLVNILHIKRYIKGRGGELVLKNGKVIPVSRNKKEDLMKLF
jgi:two-component system LytT family response regulator